MLIIMEVPDLGRPETTVITFFIMNFNWSRLSVAQVCGSARELIEKTAACNWGIAQPMFAEIVALFKAALGLGRRTCPSKDVLRLTEVGVGVRALPLRLSSSRVLSGSSRMDSDFFQNSQPALP